MAMTAEAAFTQFHDAVNVSGDHRETANARRDRVVELLGKDFTIIEAFATGSIPKFTALKNHSDLDVMVALHYGKHIDGKTPSAVLKNVRDSLSEYRTGARKNGQAVTLRYETWPSVDIVPVSREVNDRGEVTHYNVPDSNTEVWIKSRPKTHAANIETKSSECGANFRRIIKMVKHWNTTHSDYLQSYHIEALALRVFINNLDDTSWNVYLFLKSARPLLEQLLWYENSHVDSYLSDNDRREVLKRFDTAIDRSRTAWYFTYGSRNDHRSAITVWKQLFGDQFPAYG